MTRKVKRILVRISILLFIISLIPPAYYIDNPGNVEAWSNGYELVLIGWLGTVMGGGAAFAWLANPLIILSWIFFFRNLKLSMWAGILATLFAASFLLFNTVIGSEAPAYYKIIAVKPGYWLWLTNIGAFAVLTVVVYTRQQLHFIHKTRNQ